jgi:hypothetical protein
VECWLDYGFPRTGAKGYLFPAEAAMPIFQHGRPHVQSYAGPPDLAQRLATTDVDAFVSLTPIDVDTGGAALTRRPLWVMLQTGPDTFHYASDHLAGCDLLALHSPWWLEWGAARRGIVEGTNNVPALRARIEPLCRYVGYSEAEAVRLVDREAVRHQWGIPINQPVVVLLPFPQGVGRQSFWPKNIFAEPSRSRRLLNVVTHREFAYVGAAWGRENDVDVARAIRRFCDRNGAFLLIKSREKTPIPDYLRAVADHCIYDEGFYPPTIVKALSIASLCISYYSLGILETTALGVPHLCIAFRGEDYLGRRAKTAERAFFDMFFNRRDGGLFEFAGVTQTMTAGETIAALAGRTLDDFAIDAGAQHHYLQKFFGCSDGQSAARAVGAVEKLVFERGHNGERLRHERFGTGV